MTQRKITYALNKIKVAKKAGFHIEALIRSYHLNVELLRYMMLIANPEHSAKDKKIKVLVKHFQQEISLHPELKSIIHNKSLKSLTPWLVKMDQFFKAAKLSHFFETNALQQETEKIFGILNISANKLFVKQKA
ncbi:MAG: hypothetical protein PSX36_14895 [bacterium]|nr:hypothetical protein [bacterium]